MEKVYKLYEKCVNWLNGDDTYTPKEIIEEAVDVLADIKELDDLWQECVVHINNWNGNDIDCQCEQAEVLVEELSGYLGEYLG